MPAVIKKRWTVVLGLLAALAAACATLPDPADHQAWAQSLVGRPHSQVAAELGPPDHSRELGGGARLYTYSIVQADHTPMQMRRRPARDGRPVFLTEYHGPAYYNTGRLTLWVDPDGTVSRAAWENRRTVR